MEDVVTDPDHKITEEGEIDITPEFIEQWALTQLLMKDKQDDFMRMRIHATNARGATLVIKENVPYKAPDIETSIKLVGRSAKQERQDGALRRLKVVYGLLAYKLAHEKPAIKTGIEKIIKDMEDVDKSDDPKKKYTLAGIVKLGTFEIRIIWCLRQNGVGGRGHGVIGVSGSGLPGQGVIK